MTDVHYALPKGYLLYGYEIIRVLGVGGFGITYLAFDDEADRAVAIKEYFPAEFASRRDAGDMVLPSVSAESDFRWGLDRFLDEARNLLRINHPNIVEVERFLEANGTAYIVMEYVEGCTLTEYLERSGSLDEAELKPYFQLDRMIEAAFACSTRLFGLEFKALDVPLYHADCRAWDVTRNGVHVAVFIGDYFARASKRSRPRSSSGTRLSVSTSAPEKGAPPAISCARAAASA